MWAQLRCRRYIPSTAPIYQYIYVYCVPGIPVVPGEEGEMCLSVCAKRLNYSAAGRVANIIIHVIIV